MSGFRSGIHIGDSCPNCLSGKLRPIDSAGEFVPKSAKGNLVGHTRSKCTDCGWILTQNLDSRRNVRDPLRVNMPGSMW